MKKPTGNMVNYLVSWKNYLKVADFVLMTNFDAPYFFAVVLAADILAMDHESMVDTLNLLMLVERDYSDLNSSRKENCD